MDRIMNFDAFVTYEKKTSKYARDVIRYMIFSSIVLFILAVFMFGIDWPLQWLALSLDAQVISLVIPIAIYGLCGMAPTHGRHPPDYYDSYDVVLPNGIRTSQTIYENLFWTEKRDLFNKRIPDEKQICG